jgi:VanZ family protein
MRTKNVFFSYPKSILAIIGILYLSFAPPSTFDFVESVPKFPHADKVIHFGMFFVLTAVLIYEFVIRNKKIAYPSRQFLFVCILFPIAFGGIIEILQEAFFKPRSAEWLDWAADITGVLAAWAIFFVRTKNQKSRAKNFKS